MRTSAGAYFRICRGCGKVGSIVWDDGKTLSLLISSKEAGIQAVALFLENEHITLEQAIFILAQLKDSSLDERVTEKDAFWFTILENAHAAKLLAGCRWDSNPIRSIYLSIMPASREYQ